MQDWEKPIDQILEERGTTHGNYLEQSKTAQQLKSIVRLMPNWNSMMLDQRESIESMMTKVSRIGHGDVNHVDAWADLMGYPRLVYKRLVDTLRAKA